MYKQQDSRRLQRLSINSQCFIVSYLCLLVKRIIFKIRALDEICSFANLFFSCPFPMLAICFARF